MTQHPEEGTLHAYIDGELSPAETAALELHVEGCARCAAALAEARGLVAAASRVITTLDAAPASAAKAAAPVTGVVAAPSKHLTRPPVFRVPYARAAALLLLVGGTAFVFDRTGMFARGESSQVESVRADAAAGSGLAATAPDKAATVTETAPMEVPEVAAGVATGARGGATRQRSAKRSAPPPEPARAEFTGRGVAGGTAGKNPARAVDQAAVFADKDAVAPVQNAPALAAAPPPAKTTMRLEEVVVTGTAASSSTVTRYRTSAGAIITLTEEPLRTSVAEESSPRQSAEPQVQQRAAVATAAPAINSYRWSSVEQRKTYTLSGPLSVAELEALSKRLSALERLP